MDLDLAFSTIQAALKNRPADVVKDICAELAKLNTQAAKRAQWPWTVKHGELVDTDKTG